MSQKTTKRVFTRKSKLFLVLASMILALSCKNPLGDESGGSGGSGGAGGGSGGQTITNKDGRVFPAWYLTEQQQQKNFSIGPTILFDTRRNDGKPNLLGDQQYRIPAIIAATNGNIIVFADNRYNHGNDIGVRNAKKIDIVYKVSKDGGNSWSQEKTIPPLSPSASLQNADNKGDVAVFKHPDGTLVAMAVSGGGYSSGGNANTPSRMVRSESKDNGDTWSQWQEVGQALFNTIKTKHGKAQAFMTSGRGLTLKDGTFVNAMGGPDWSIVYVYSKDKGMTWNYGQYIKGSESSGGKYTLWVGEPKVIAQLDDGKLLMSIRNATQSSGNRNTPRKFIISTTSADNDPNVSWPTQLSSWNFIDGDVDAEGVLWTSKKDGADITRILHIQAGPQRRKGLALYLSIDEGKTFTKKYDILANNIGACYSSIDVLGDGTVITAAEEQSDNGQYYDIVFRRYNMKTLTGEVYKTEWYK